MRLKLSFATLRQLLILIGTVACSTALGQTAIRGRVTDAATNLGIGGVTVSLPPTARGTSTDSLGYYILPHDSTATHIRFDALGYKTVSKSLLPNQSQPIDVALEEDFQTLDEVIISGKGRYRNQNNPAVDLIRKVIEYKPANRLSRFDHASVEIYEKIMMGVTEIPKFVAQGRLTQNYRFAFENVDTTLLPGRSVLPVYLEENVSTRYLRMRPKTSKTIVSATKKTELDQRYVNNRNIEAYFKFIHGDIDIYENNILILNKPFLSPTADAAPVFYKFFILDTLSIDQGQFVELLFVPRNEQDRLFSGKLQIALDGNYGIRRADIWIGRQANLDWVNHVDISLHFSRHHSGIYLLSYSDMRIDFSPHGGKPGAFGQRTLVYRKYDTETPIPRGTFEGQLWQKEANADNQSDEYWHRSRPSPLTETEARTYANTDSLQHNRAFQRTLKWGYILSKGFVPAGGIEFGPFEYSYSFNELEGSRLRLSGRTTPQLSPNFYAEGYLAYGFGDQRVKFYGGAAHTLNGRQIGEYPSHYLQATYQRDAREPGQQLGFRNGDNFVRSFRSGPQDNWLYHDNFRVSHVIEFGNHFMLQTSLASLRQTPAAQLRFVTSGNPADTLSTLQATEIGFDLRWAPNEEFFQRNLDRSPIVNEYPIFNLRYNMGIKNLLGSGYDYHALRLNVFKRVFLSQLGLADISMGAGYIFGTVPYPLLDIPNANQAYLLTPDAYNLMNNLEFVSDQYFKLSIEHRLHGFILNKIPLLKLLKLREVAGFKLLYGNVRHENRPADNPHLLLLPTNEHGSPTTFLLQRTPYMEASAGLENILNIFRIEYVRRLSYLDHPNIRKAGIRFGVKIDF
ncbi:CarboxypepD_reg-like domain-containing protein [Parapedobacter composti]|uniref:CarboxypepD_reg-like domain-containing protein n=1 Tax=Parapedobacter composti TaxID=623281 RepID=A0A1I1IZ76_9SPHI|nr:DUF5686 and carboxypeptidase-like regulatory domain-containing protein [Parapedobacter composti]SFC41546.1 CarboxypepD_reg-like domain-containing protein [Parapedobacter composti]